MTLLSAFEKSAPQAGGRTALLFGERKISYQRLLQSSQAMGTALAELGVLPGDRVVVILPNAPEYVALNLAAWYQGASLVPLNPLLRPGEIEQILSDARPRVIFGPAHLSKRLKTGGAKYVPSDGKSGFSLSTLAATRPKRSLLHHPKPSQCAALLYTSGTTGKPKGAMLSHANLYKNVQACTRAMKVTTQDVSVCALPLFHSFGFTCCLHVALYNTAKLVLVERFIPQMIIDVIERQRVTLFCGVPTMFAYLLNQPGVRPKSLKSLRMCFSGGAPLAPEVIKAFEARFGTELREGYGLTETSPVVTCTPLSRKRKLESVGLPISGVQIKIVSDDGKDLPPGEVGEIAIKGHNVMMGYFNKEEETAEVLRDGWFYTGDLGKLDEEGYLYIVGRKKDLVIVGGFNVYPREIIEVLLTHPKIADAHVFGVEDQAKGEAVKALIVPQPRTKLAFEEVLDFCRENLAPYKVPRFIEFVKELPKTATGKVIRDRVK